MTDVQQLQFEELPKTERNQLQQFQQISANGIEQFEQQEFNYEIQKPNHINQQQKSSICCLSFLKKICTLKFIIILISIIPISYLLITQNIFPKILSMNQHSSNQLQFQISNNQNVRDQIEKREINPNIQKNQTDRLKQKSKKQEYLNEKQKNSKKILKKIDSDSLAFLISADKTNQDKKTQQSTQIHPQKPFQIRQQFRQKTPKPNPQEDLYNFQVSIQQLISTSPLKSTYRSPNTQWQKISQSQYVRAIRLMQVTHNINFKGQYQFDHFNFYSTPQQKYLSLSKILKQQKEYFEQKYQISKYIHSQIRFCVIVPSYNNAQKNRLYLRNLDSIFQQQYKNYKLIYMNDASTDNTGEYVQNYMQVNQITQDKYKVVNNKKNMGGDYNIYTAVHEHCELGEVMVLIDGDDALIGRQVFALLNAIYQRQKVALTYGQFLILNRDKIIRNGPTVDIMPYIKKGQYPRALRRFMTGHLKTMYVDVFRQIKKQDLTYPDGKFYDFSTDLTFITPALQLVGERSRYTGQVIYQRRFGTGSNEPSSQQDRIAGIIFQKPAYKPLSDFSFADNPKTTNYSLF